MNPRETIQAFDHYLADKSLRLEAVVIGGAVLNLLEVIDRPTKDCDVLSPVLPDEILRAAGEFAAEARSRGEILRDDWINNGPASLVDVLPPGWRERLLPAPVFVGKAIVLHSLGRADLLKTKLFALCDRGEDIGDCLALAPTADELADALPWVERQDANELWPDHVRSTLADLGRRLGHAV
jgi:hypothetical protein